MPLVRWIEPKRQVKAKLEEAELAVCDDEKDWRDVPVRTGFPLQVGIVQLAYMEVGAPAGLGLHQINGIAALVAAVHLDLHAANLQAYELTGASDSAGVLIKPLEALKNAGAMRECPGDTSNQHAIQTPLKLNVDYVHDDSDTGESKSAGVAVIVYNLLHTGRPTSLAVRHIQFELAAHCADID